eukprot:5563334-Amphidinium_carterae.1
MALPWVTALLVAIAVWCILWSDVPGWWFNSCDLSSGTHLEEEHFGCMSSWNARSWPQRMRKARWFGRRRLAERVGLRTRLRLKRAWLSVVSERRTDNSTFRTCGARLGHVQAHALALIKARNTEVSTAIATPTGVNSLGLSCTDRHVEIKSPACPPPWPHSTATECQHPAHLPYRSYTFQDYGDGCIYRCVQMILAWFLHVHRAEQNPHVPSLRNLVRVVRQGPEANFSPIPWLSAHGAAHLWCTYTQRAAQIEVCTTPQDMARLLRAHFSEVGTPVMMTTGIQAFVVSAVHPQMSNADSVFVTLNDPHAHPHQPQLRAVQRRFQPTKDEPIVLLQPWLTPAVEIPTTEHSLTRCGAPNQEGADTYQNALNRTRRCTHSLSDQQVKLLLRGDEKLQRRIVTAKNDDMAQQIFVSAAIRYGLVEKGTGQRRAPSQDVNAQQRQRDPPTQRPQSSPPDQRTENWTHVSRRKAWSNQGTTEEPSELHLYASDWSHPVLSYPSVGCCGVYLSQNSEDAWRAERYILGSVQPVAVIAIQPLSQAKVSTPITFRVTQVSPNKQPRERIMNGFLNQYATDLVHHGYRVLDLQTKRTPVRTVVLSCAILRWHIWGEEWKSVTALDTVDKLNEFLRPHRLTAQDIFHIKIENNFLKFMVRVTDYQAHYWMKASTLPFTVSPVGTESEKYSIIWDSTVKYLQQMHQQYDCITGFVNVVSTPRGLGCRVTAASHDAALQQLGRTPGQTYELHGLPLSACDTDVTELLAAMPWEAELLPRSRRVKGPGVTAWRVRSQCAPASNLVRYYENWVRWTIHITPLAKRAPPPKPPRVQDEPQTWADVAKRA